MGITLWRHLCDRAEAMRREALRDAGTLADWQKTRPRRHREFMRSLGLDPLPRRCDLAVTDYGAFAGKGFTGRRVAFQVMPDCWASACVYYPDPLPAERAPGVLYVCGHGPSGTGNYQASPILWARRGYVCLIVDTIEQLDNPGEHHGLEAGRHEAWLALGYTAAGGETWNAMRALDALAADSRVDPGRLGVTGISGGGACSFFLAAADERVKALSTLCGVSTPYDAIVNRHLISHCNCMYPHNIYRRDTSEFAALIAPRAALFCCADDDRIFHPGVVSALVERTRQVYDLYGLAEQCSLTTCPGGHSNHPAFDEATSRWFDRYLADGERPMTARGKPELAEQVVTVFNGQPPVPNHLDLLPGLLSPRGSVPLPLEPGDWPDIRRRALQPLATLLRDEGEASFQPVGRWKTDHAYHASHRGLIAGMEVWLNIFGPPGPGRRILLGIAGPGEGSMDIMGLAGSCVDPSTTVAAGFEPRLSGVSYPAPDAGPLPAGSLAWSVRKLLPLALPLTGLTPVAMTVRDIGAALDYLAANPDTRDCAVYLYGRADAGVAALYRGLTDERVAGVILENAPGSHLAGAPLIGILRLFDMPQAVGLMAPRKVALVNPGHGSWSWSSRAYGRLGVPEHLVMIGDLARAVRETLT